MGFRVAVVQFAPKIGHVQENINKANKLLENVKPHSVDLVCLPEMIFTGYCFANGAAIKPFLETPEKGPTSLFCAELAKRLQCYVIAGYPEALGTAEHRGTIILGSSRHEEVGANSAVTYGPDGCLIGNYRKTNLFDTDKPWAKPGTGFAAYALPPPIHTMGVGICMDLNTRSPGGWTLNKGPYEIADFCIENKVTVLVLLNAWLDSLRDTHDPVDWSTMNYWAARLRPLWARVGGAKKEECESDESLSEGEDPALGHETIVIVCNRSGQEDGKNFAGTSTMFSMRRGSGWPQLLQHMGRNTEAVRIWTA